MGRSKNTVVLIEHEDGDDVYCWTQEQGVETVRSCLNTHPREPISVKTIEMTAKEYDSLPDYEGDC